MEPGKSDQRPTALLDGTRLDEGEPLITPEASVGYSAALEGLTVAELGAAPVVITVWGQRMFDGLRSRLAAEPLRGWWYGTRVPHVLGSLHTASCARR